jgi:hypothetical protein
MRLAAFGVTDGQLDIRETGQVALAEEPAFGSNADHFG